MESTDTVTKKLADAISTLGLAMNDMSADMRTLVQTQQQITNALVDRQQSRLRSSEATQEVNRVETVIRKPATVHEEDIKTVIKKSDPTMSESQLEGILGSIKHHADLSILALKESRGDAAPNLTWAKLKTETVPTMSGFEAVVKDKYSVRFDLCEASWASKHILSQKWDNKKHYRTRASDNRPAKRPRVENDRQAKRVPRLSSRMSESPTAGAPKVTQIGTQSGPGASSTLPEASSSIHSLSTFGPVDGTYMEQQQTHHSPLMYTTSNGHTLHDIECNSETFPDPQYQRSYPCSEFDPQCPRYPDMTVPPQTAGYSRLLQQPFSPFQQNLHSGMSRLQGQSSDPSPSTDGAQPRCNTNHVNSATHTAYSTPQPQSSPSQANQSSSMQFLLSQYTRNYGTSGRLAAGRAGAGDVERTENSSLEKENREQEVNSLSLETNGTKTIAGRPRKTYVKTNRVLRSQKSLMNPDGENGGRQGDANGLGSRSDEEERLTPTKKKRGGQAKRKKASV